MPSAEPCDLAPASVARRFHRMLARGARLRPLGTARDDPESLLSLGYTPKAKIELFDDVAFYLAGPRQNPDIRFFMAYVDLDRHAERKDLHPRIFYKDVSLVWRSASHYVRTEDENWIGKGEVRPYRVDGEVLECSSEETTDLPLEIQTALETLNQRLRRVPHDDGAIELVLRGGHTDRIAPYRDFVEPRRRARENPRNRINGGRPVARFTRAGDPTSLRFTPGYEPDFERGILERSRSRSSMYGGVLERVRILSRNRGIQYLFFAGPDHVWVIPPQATTTELSSYGVRTVDVIADEHVCLPGFEYHFWDHSGEEPELHTQIPAGYAGEPSAHDASRADTSAWLDRLPVVQEFRRKVLGRSGGRRR